MASEAIITSRGAILAAFMLVLQARPARLPAR
jgi:hypothetical protein